MRFTDEEAVTFKSVVRATEDNFIDPPALRKVLCCLLALVVVRKHGDEADQFSKMLSALCNMVQDNDVDAVARGFTWPKRMDS